ncbi:hypothetical protein Tco_1028537 [Tanacetum coccineum]|uniref:Uncharacterized protein n=1 Tax=Tanacetum coccineum TaxID=301880 RepID=A0ABQ5G147_9ASTR
MSSRDLGRYCQLRFVDFKLRFVSGGVLVVLRGYGYLKEKKTKRQSQIRQVPNSEWKSCEIQRQKSKPEEVN